MAASQPSTLDLRPRAAYLQQRLPGSVSIPCDELQERLFELPPKGSAIAVVVGASAEGAAVVADHEAAVAGLVKAGWHATMVNAADVAASEWQEGPTPLPRPRLWEPAGLVRASIAGIEAQLARPNGAGIALDVGCGSGRDAAFLAERGWSVLGIENRLKLAVQAHGVAGRFSASSGHDPFMFHIKDAGLPLRPSSLDLILCVRFLHRPLLSKLARYLRPGGFLLYSHFVDGVQHVGTPKNPAGYHMHDELLEVARAAGLVVTLHRETTLEDGRPIVEFLAQRPAAAWPGSEAEGSAAAEPDAAAPV